MREMKIYEDKLPTVIINWISKENSASHGFNGYLVFSMINIYGSYLSGGDLCLKKESRIPSLILTIVECDSPLRRCCQLFLYFILCESMTK